LGGQVGIDHKTASKYIAVFEQMYLMQRVAVWSGNRLSRLLKTPKLHFLDSGLLSVMVDFSDPMKQRKLFGQLLESFVFAELRKQITWAEGEYGIFYYRDKDQNEVDFVIENAAGEIIGVEVKSSASVSVNDLVGLKKLASLAQQSFRAGIILYDGIETLPIGQVDGRTLWAVPISTLASSKLL
jgi:uncharacterized protein